MLVYPVFCSCDLDLDPMTLTYEFDLGIVRCTCIPKMKFLGQGFQKLEQDTHRDRHSDTQTDENERIAAAAFAGGENN